MITHDLYPTVSRTCSLIAHTYRISVGADMISRASMRSDEKSIALINLVKFILSYQKQHHEKTSLLPFGGIKDYLL